MKSVLIVVAGGTASGKTTVVDKISQRLKSKDVQVIRFDDYYKDLSNLSMEERAKVNFDHPDSLDNDLMYEQLRDLLDGKKIEKPLYDFKTHTRKKETEQIHPSKVIIVEGILALYDPRVRDIANIKIFVESDDDIRFIRRLRRDMTERGRSLESVIEQYLGTVKPMYYEFIKPTKRYADIIIPNDNNHEVAVDIVMAKVKEIINKKEETK
ncbi:MAG: uridine kinase [Acholeplasmatales bacterium]|nr:uridine kinase [Acholeplasmatales bacterium]